MGAELGTKSTMSEPNVVPLCDILLVLLIIFMVITPMVKKGANVQLPEAVTSIDQESADDMVTVSLNKKGDIFISGKKIENITELPVRIQEEMDKKKQQEKKVLFKADINVEYGAVTDLMDAIRRAGIENIALITDKKASGV
jgi:biopolymer transport protein ExbD